MNSATWIKEKLKKYTAKEIYKMYDNFVKETGATTSKESFKGTVRSIKSQMIKNKKLEDKTEVEIEYKKNKQIININSSKIQTDDEAFSYLNLNKDDWEVLKQKKSRWGNGENDRKSIQLEVKPKVKVFDDKIKENFIKDMLNHSPKCYKPIKRKIIKKDKCMAQINIFDLHFGLLSWFREVGVNYDIKIAEKIMKDAINYFLSTMEQFNIENILFPVGSDYYNVNNAANTTFKGTLQDEDCRWQKSYERGRILLVSILDQLRNKADVDVLVIPGNHDTERSFYLGDALYCWYHNDPCVNINNEPTLRKYYQYYQNLIGLSHGDKIKDDKFPIIMATEAKKMWANTTYREFHKGHEHHEKVKLYDGVIEIAGVKIRSIPALTAPSAWIKSMGYLALQEAQMFIWHPQKGNIAQSNYHI